MNQIKQASQEQISNDALVEFEKFKNWHFELKNALDALKLTGEKELEYLNEILPEYRKSLLHNSFFDLKEGKVLSLAAGPAQEIYEYMQKQNNLKFLALDHDIETLKNASKNNQELRYGIINAFHLIKGNTKYLIPKENKLDKCYPKKDTKGVKQLLLPLKYSIKRLKEDEFDLIYSAGYLIIYKPLKIKTKVQ